jgi:hypothetical protein
MIEAHRHHILHHGMFDAKLLDASLHHWQMHYAYIDRTLCLENIQFHAFWYIRNAVVFHDPQTPKNATSLSAAPHTQRLAEMYTLLVKAVQQLQKVALITQSCTLIRKLRLHLQHSSYLFTDEL